MSGVINQWSREKIQAMTPDQLVALVELCGRFNQACNFRKVLKNIQLDPFGLPEGYIGGGFLNEDGSVKLAFGISPEGRVST